ncbi:MAG: hypothetical protein EOP47_23605 [Sphingobacteriaceae bacterium]|nr:MAG: hypothetical protein EOP47_23605 [Sphingobacteriaceae bacterium]
MSVLVTPHNEQEEKVLLAFLDSLRYDYRADIESNKEVAEAFLSQYNKEIDEAEADIEAGNYVAHDEVENFFGNRKNTTGGNKVE